MAADAGARRVVYAAVAIAAIALSFCAGVVARPYIKAIVAPTERLSVNPRVSQFQGLPNSADVVLLGDSLTDHGRWSELLPGRVANRGIGRDTVDMVAARADRLPDGPVFVMVGVNDLSLGRSVADVVASYEVLLDRLGDRRVIVQSVLGPANLPVPELNEALSKLSARRGLEFLDLTPLLGYPLRPTYDGIHLTAEGYRLWAAEIKDRYSPSQWR